MTLTFFTPNDKIKSGLGTLVTLDRLNSDSEYRYVPFDTHYTRRHI